MRAATRSGAASPSLIGRIFAGLALLAALVPAFRSASAQRPALHSRGGHRLVTVLLTGGSSGYSYKLLFETGGQIVPGNEVLVAGQPVGTVDSIDLTEDSQAAITTPTTAPLHEQTSAVIRLSSLSGAANRYVALTRGPDNLPELEEGSTITGEDTT